MSNKAGASALFMSFKGALCASAAAGAFSGAAVAQETGDEAAPDAQRRLNAVVVEATRREGVTVQDVPVAVTAFDAQLLENSNFERVNDLEQLSPSVQISQGQSASAGTSISIRGIGTGADNFGFEPAVGIFVDGVFRTRTGIGISELPELSGVEVLRGPQGTLFGRNTSAGVVNIRTAGPEFDPRASVRLTAGNFEGLEAGFTATGALLENIAGRVDVNYRRRDGFINDINTGDDVNNIDRVLVRSQLLWEEGDQSARFIADYSMTDEDCCAAVLDAAGVVFPPTSDAFSVAGLLLGGTTADVVQAGAAGAGVIGFIDPADQPTRFDAAFTPGRPFQDDVEEFGFSLEYENELSFGNFTSITSYREFEAVRSQDIDFSGFDRAFREGQINRDRSITQEFRLQDEVGPLDWLVGVFYLNQRIDAIDNIQFGAQADLFTDGVFASFTPALAPSLIGTPLEPLAGVPLQLFGTVPGAPSAFAALLAADPAALGGLIGAGVLTPGGFLPGTPTGAGQQDDFFELDTNAIAIFTHNELEVTDRLTATIGVRYNYEDRDLKATQLAAVVPACDSLTAIAGLAPDIADLFRTGGPFSLGGLLACNPAVNPEANALEGAEDQRTESEVTGTFRLTYELTDNFRLIAGYSRGFKSGSFNVDRSGFTSAVFSAIDPETGLPTSSGPSLDDLEFDNETVNSFEAGFKSEFLNGNLIVNAVGFYQDINDFQENVFNGSNFLVAGSDVENFGAELDVTASPFDGLILQGGFIYVVAEREEDLPFVPGSAGLQLGNTPEFVLTGQASYERELLASITGFAHMNVRWQSETNISVFPSVNEVSANGAFATVGARLGVRGPDNAWEFSAFGTNLFDQEFNVIGFAIPEQENNFAVFPGEPRFWGLELKVNFK